MKNNTAQLRPANVMLHPVWLAALALLVFNDHFLKASELWPALSGKLSDFAGLLVAPVLFAVIMRVRSRRGLWMSAAATGAVFSAINLSPALAAHWDAMVSTVMPYRTTVDPTDLIALVMLPLGLVMFGPVMRAEFNRSRAQRTAQLAVAAFGVVMCTATSEDASCATNADCDNGFVCVDEWCEYVDPDDPNTGSNADSNGASMMTMVEELETEQLDEVSIEEIGTLPLESLDPALIEYLRDDSDPLAR